MSHCIKIFRNSCVGKLFAALAVCAVFVSGSASAATSVSQFGITWTFDKDYTVGQFANGDYYVVAQNGYVNVVDINPRPSFDGSAHRNGTMINPDPAHEYGTGGGGKTYQGFDSRLDKWAAFSSALNKGRPNGQNISWSNPMRVPSGSSVVSSISRNEHFDWSRKQMQLLSVAILTVLDKEPPAGSFRPPYVGTDKTIRFKESDLNYNALGRYPLVSNATRLKQQSGDAQKDSLERMFERPWLDYIRSVGGSYAHPQYNMPGDGAWMTGQVGMAGVTLNSNISNADKRTLLIRFTQLGIDNYAIAMGGGTSTWGANGQIGCGRKFPILFAGLVLNTPNAQPMRDIGKHPIDKPAFAEDSQTFYVSQADVDMTHSSQWNPDTRNGPAEKYYTSDIGMPEWGIQNSWSKRFNNKAWSAIYRTSNGTYWGGYILATHMMNAVDLWGHQALFDYMDRYMKNMNNAQSHAWTGNMWGLYRYNLVYGPKSGLVLSEIPDKTVTEGNDLVFNISAINSEGTVKYSAQNLPAGAKFEGQTFSWYNVTYSSADKLFESQKYDVTFVAADSVSEDKQTVQVTVEPKDSNNDGLPDAWKMHYFGTLDVHPEDDPDGDGLTNMREYLIGTNPLVYDEVPPHLAIHFKFDTDPAMGIIDSSMYGTNATCTTAGTPLLVEGNDGKAYEFDGLYNAVELPTTNMKPQAGTISMWVNPIGFPNQKNFLFGHASPTWSDRIQLYCDVNGTLHLGLGDSSARHTNITDLVVGQWDHIALTWDSVKYAVYVNGEVLASGPYSGLGKLNSYADIGNTGNSNVRVEGFKGVIDDVRIYNADLTQPEIQAIYDNVGKFLFAPIGNKTVDEGQTLTFTVETYDKNTEVFLESHTLPGRPDFSANVFNWPADFGDAGQYEAVFVAPHGDTADEDYEKITVTVNKVNRPPVFEPLEDVAVNDNEQISFTVSATDPDNDKVTITATDLPEGAKFDGTNFSWTPSREQEGVYDISFTASDGTAETVETVQITVTVVNTPPVLNPVEDQVITAGSNVTFNVSATDAEGDTVTITAADMPAGASFENETFSWTPDYAQVGTHAVRFVASDGRETSDMTVNIIVEKPEANYSMIGHWKFDDGSGTTAVDSSGNNTAVLANGPVWTVGYFNGGLQFDGNDDAVEVTTNGFNANSGTVAMWAKANSYPNHKNFLFGHATQPWSNRIHLYTTQNGELILGLGDKSQVSRSATLDTEWNHIALTWNNGTYSVYVNGSIVDQGSYTGLAAINDYADIGNNGNRAVRVEAFDGTIDEVIIYSYQISNDMVAQLASAEKNNNPPVFDPVENKTVVENQELQFTVSATDPDGDTVTYSAANLPKGAVFSGNRFSWTPVSGQAGSYDVVFTATDGKLDTNQTVSITVEKEQVTPRGLIGHWKFDQSSGLTATDSSGLDNHGSLVNDPYWTTGKINNGIGLDYSNQAIEVPADNFNAESGAIALWVNAESFPNSKNFIFGHATQPWSNRIQLYADRQGGLILGLGESSRTNAKIGTLVPGSWHHVALVWNSGTYTVYLNGSAAVTGSYSGLDAINSYADIGNNGNRAVRVEAFRGVVDDVRVFNGPITADDIAAIIQEAPSSIIDSATGFFSFDEGQGTTTSDLTGTTGDAVLVNDTSWSQGRSGYAVSFNADNNAVEVTTAGLRSEAGTIAVWTYPRSFMDGKNFLFGHATQPWSNRIQLFTNSNGTLALGFGDNSYLNSEIAVLTTNKWQHVALTWNGSTYTVYVNGTAAASGSYSGLTALNGYVDLGNNGNRSVRVEAFDGLIDEFCTFDRALSVEEIAELIQ